MPELDGLRAVAISLVMLHHFSVSAGSSTPVLVLNLVASAGWIGVDLFFVLSGFLITGICLDHRGQGFFRVFYSRRALRILPVYSIALIGIVAVSHAVTSEPMRGIPWLLTFTTNVFLARTGDWHALPSAAAHLWSLAVEEQFYLVWPLIAIVLSRRSAALAAVIAIPAAIAFRAVAILGESSAISAYVLMPARMDSLATGALLAFAIRDPTTWRGVGRKLQRIGGLPLQRWIGGLLLVWVAISLWSQGGPGSVQALRIGGFSLVAGCAGVLLAATLVAEHSAPLRVVLRHPVARSIGRYSYAMYLFHLPIDVALREAGVNPSGIWQAFAFVAGASAITFGFAAVSWRVVERPCLELKRYFPYRDLVIAGPGRPLGVARAAISAPPTRQ